jgi:hypothetical protein
MNEGRVQADGFLALDVFHVAAHTVDDDFGMQRRVEPLVNVAADNVEMDITGDAMAPAEILEQVESSQHIAQDHDIAPVNDYTAMDYDPPSDTNDDGGMPDLPPQGTLSDAHPHFAVDATEPIIQHQEEIPQEEQHQEPKETAEERRQKAHVDFWTLLDPHVPVVEQHKPFKKGQIARAYRAIERALQATRKETADLTVHEFLAQAGTCFFKPCGIIMDRLANGKDAVERFTQAPGSSRIRLHLRQGKGAS